MSAVNYLRKILPQKLIVADRLISECNIMMTYGLMRSGQHLIISWICRGLKQPSIHFNHCRFIEDGKFYTLAPVAGRRIIYDAETIEDSGKQSLHNLRKSLPENLPRNLLFSIEDIAVSKRKYKKITKRYGVFRIVILRDPANWLASSLRHGVHSNVTLRQHAATLKKHLRLACAETGEHKNEFLFINYNRFCSDADYRIETAKKLADLDEFDASRADEALPSIPDFGGGSSFDTASGQSERWKEYVTSPAYRSILNDVELYELSKEFFGEIEPVVELKRVIDAEAPKPKIFYIGLSRTGTTTLHDILSQLGYNSRHFCDFLMESPKWDEVMQYDALGDAPLPLLYQELDKRHPGSKFILTARNKETWLDSMEWMFDQGSVIWNWADSDYDYHYRLSKARVFDREILGSHWENYHDEVKSYFSDRPNDLLTIKLEEGFDVKTICDFLGIEHMEISVDKINPRRTTQPLKLIAYRFRRALRVLTSKRGD